MDDPIPKLKTPEECAIFARNATDRGRADMAVRAKKRAIELRAASYGAKTEVERECVEAVYAYEETLTMKNGRRQSASRTWPMLEKYGIIGAVEKVVSRKDATLGYTALVELGLEEYAFEAVILRHQSAFSEEAVKRSRERMPGDA
ncbi:MAG: hypothetical protein ACK6DW_09160 [Betaproteobacteria bacterium]|jgi:hypothetical protein